MLKFQQPPKEYSEIYLEDTDRPLPEKLNPHTRYMFLSTIAKGGKSLIRSCRDMHLNRVVAHKSLRSECATDPTEQRRLLREARVTANLQHPNTPPTYEIGRDRDGKYYFTMKLVHGYTLRDIMDYRERYDLIQLVTVIEQIGHALRYAHAHGVAHRDIKPENILVGPYDEVLLLDWGLAKVWKKDGTAPDETDEYGVSVAGDNKSMTGRGKLQGTPCYMSPEQMRRDPGIGFSTDVYSLATVLYELLSGVLPFDAEHSREIIKMVETQEPPKPSEVGKYPIPGALEVLIMQCLQKNPADRPSMKEFVNTLRDGWEPDV